MKDHIRLGGMQHTEERWRVEEVALYDIDEMRLRTMDAILNELAAVRQESKTQIVVEARDLLRDRLLAQQMEAGYRRIGDDQIALAEAMQPLVAEALPE